jgi:hypothetical protein
MVDNYIAEWDETKWIVGSSWTFCIPAVYAYTRQFYINSVLLVITSIISANFWRKATYSWRRNLDLVYAKFVFVVFVSQGVYYVRYIPYFIVSYPLMGTLIYCYYLSEKYHKIKYPYWYRYHVAFHLMMTCELFMIIDSLPKTTFPVSQT